MEIQGRPASYAEGWPLSLAAMLPSTDPQDIKAPTQNHSTTANTEALSIQCLGTLTLSNMVR